MSNIVISVENLSKEYQLGLIGGKTLRDDVARWWARARRKPDPLLKIGQADHGNRNGEILWALRDINFEVRQGEVVGIIGRNGAGKSTLLKILSRITAPTSGQVKVKGRIASLLEVGTGFHPELTGRENIYLNGSILGMRRAEIDRKLDEIVDFSGVEKFIDTPVKRYSSGMYVRLAFAVAAHLEPEILLVDEVLAVGDAEFQKKCLGKMGEVAREGRTVLFVSHNMASIQNLTSRSFLLQGGLLKALGLTEDIIQIYLSAKAESAKFPISSRTDRTGRSPGSICSLTLTSHGQEIGDLLLVGSQLELHISYSCLKDEGELDFFVAFYDLFEERILHVNTIMKNQISVTAPSQGTVTCIVPKILLSPGTYSIAVAVDCKGYTLDRIENAQEIHIVMGDYFKTGRTRGAEWGKVLVDHAWELVS
jgi:lipopolysaccharide transport system ATP-binding protein